MYKTNKRNNHGIIVSIIGIIVNLILFIIKLGIGLFLSSTFIIGDAINNLTDFASAIVMLLGFKIGNRKPDNKHPFGYGRIEYIAALIVAFIIFVMGYELFVRAVLEIISPQVMDFSVIALVILFITVLVKVGLYYFYKKQAKQLSSNALFNVAIDARNDCYITLVSIISIIIYKSFNLNLDGVLTLLLAIYILKSGFDIILNTVSPLLGESIDKDLAAMIESEILKYEQVLGCHDLVVHNYGHNQNMASIHVEVDSQSNLLAVHQILDKIEVDLYNDFNIILVTHVDPVERSNEFLIEVSQFIKELVASYDVDVYDFRIVKGTNHENVIFDMKIPHHYGSSKIKEIQYLIQSKTEAKYGHVHCIIDFRYSYIK